jgi:hypothetical protein
LELADQLIPEAQRLGGHALAWHSALTSSFQLVVLRWQQGRTDEVEGLIRRSAAQYSDHPSWRCLFR